jgi:hypothetical protein
MKADALWCSELQKTRKAKRTKNWLFHLGNTNKTMSVIRIGLCARLFYRDPEGSELPKSVMNKIILFQKKQKKDTIDIWWLSDDGGMRPQKILCRAIQKLVFLFTTRFDTSFAGYHQQQIKLVRHSTTHILYSIRSPSPRVGTRTKRVCFFDYIL